MVEEFLRMVANKKVVAFTGAGASQESGIPTFRGKLGLWQKYDPSIYATLPYAFHTFLKNPEKIAGFLIDFYKTLLSSQPNSTHYALARLEEDGRLTGTITQNIDNLHQFAGTKRISELHGNSYKFVCRKCQREYLKDKQQIIKFIDDLTGVEYTRKQLRKKVLSFMGKCKCNKLLTTTVVFFGQGLPGIELQKAYRFIDEAEICLCIGTSGVVIPAASFPFYAKEKGCKVIEVNPEFSEISPIADLTINQPSSVFFSSVLDYLS